MIRKLPGLPFSCKEMMEYSRASARQSNISAIGFSQILRDRFKNSGDEVAQDLLMAFSRNLISESAHQSLCGRIRVENIARLVTEADGLIQDIQSGSEHLLDIRKIT